MLSKVSQYYYDKIMGYDYFKGNSLETATLSKLTVIYMYTLMQNKVYIRYYFSKLTYKR